MLLKNLHLRRIHWAIFSPSLLAYPYCVDYIRDEAHRKAVIQLLQELDSRPDEVNAHFHNLGAMPMGKYFEQLLFYIIDKDERFEIVLKNHQVQEGNITIGELDLLLRDTATGQLEHWEIALKYYLQSAPSSDFSAMIGPDAKDNLDQKMKKLTEHQMRLSSHPKIRGLFNGEQIESKLFMKGQFFFRQGQKKTLPQHSNPFLEQGYWCFLSEAEEVLNDELKWLVIEKPDWIGQITLTDDATLLSAAQILDFLKKQFDCDNESILCVGFSESNFGWIENTRGFVVSNRWPSTRAYQ
ncbi:MAG: DUF1853 family protein [Flavobacteriales bacterium]|nr:DUF1853 family protein [Flavobacteriales bacterium]